MTKSQEKTQDQTVEEDPHAPKKTPYQKLPDKITQKVTVNVAVSNPKAKLGIRVGRMLNICNVQAGSPVSGQLKPGDLILSLNDTKIKERQQFEDILSKVADGKYKFEVRRPKAPEALEKESEIMKALPKAYDLVPGCKYYIGYLCVYPGASLGIHIMSLDSKVYVTNAPPNSLSGEVFSMGDAVLAIDGVPVTTVKMCSSQIKDALYSKGWCKTLLERPMTSVAKKRAKAALKTEKSMEIDPKMAEDIQPLCFDVIEALIKEKDKEPAIPKSLLKSKSDGSKKVVIAENSEEAGIGCDPFNPDLLQNVEPIASVSLSAERPRPPSRRMHGDKKPERKTKSNEKKDNIAAALKKKLRTKLNRGKSADDTTGTVEEATKEEGQ